MRQNTSSEAIGRELDALATVLHHGYQIPTIGVMTDSSPGHNTALPDTWELYGLDMPNLMEGVTEAKLQSNIDALFISTQHSVENIGASHLVDYKHFSLTIEAEGLRDPDGLSTYNMAAWMGIIVADRLATKGSHDDTYTKLNMERAKIEIAKIVPAYTGSFALMCANVWLGAAGFAGSTLSSAVSMGRHIKQEDIQARLEKDHAALANRLAAEKPLIRPVGELGKPVNV